MNLAKSGGEKKMINFLVTLVNVVEVSVVLIGTPKALRLFASEFRQARRASGDGSVVWDRLSYDESWEDFLTELWPYQWLNKTVTRNEQLTKKLYELSQGIPDIVVKLFCLAQARAILLAGATEEETISIELLEQVFEDEFSIVKPMLEALNSGNQRKIEECNDLIFPQLESNLINAVNQLVAKPLQHPKKIELGEPTETHIANSAIQTIVSMGVAEDIAQPLIADTLAKKPNLQLIELIQYVTTTLTKPEHIPKTRPKPEYTSQNNWVQLPANDMRKVYSEKSGSMYESMKNYEKIYPVQKLLEG